MKKKQQINVSNIFLVQNSADLHELFVRFSHLWDLRRIRTFIHPFVSQVLYNICVRVLSDIQHGRYISDTTRSLIL